ncbi:MAG: HDOD domain-containing protein [Pseudomonadota bacterium]
MSVADLRQGIQNLDSLPALPVIAQRLLALDLESHEGERKLLELIEQDPFISAKLVGLANTPLFVMPQKVTRLSDAAMLLGLTRVKSVAMGIAIMTSVANKPLGRLDLDKLWLHSLAVALGMRTLAHAMPRERRPDDETLFLVGLLHDIGYVVLARLDPIRSDALHMRLATDTSLTVSGFEREMFEMGHAELGAALARHWGLPEDIGAVLRDQHADAVAMDASGQPLLDLLRLTEKLLGPVGIHEGVLAEVVEDDWRRLGIDPARADELASFLRQQAEEAKASAQRFA